ncbi:hypothetical protein DFH06DRAFT_1150797 [Mycena polygramma]|nr:hypothetical protein DFH06DRAFT_1150797 [Mycena polygramma]
MGCFPPLQRAEFIDYHRRGKYFIQTIHEYSTQTHESRQVGMWFNKVWMHMGARSTRAWAIGWFWTANPLTLHSRTLPAENQVEYSIRPGGAVCKQRARSTRAWAMRSNLVEVGSIIPWNNMGSDCLNYREDRFEGVKAWKRWHIEGIALPFSENLTQMAAPRRSILTKGRAISGSWTRTWHVNVGDNRRFEAAVWFIYRLYVQQAYKALVRL